MIGSKKDGSYIISDLTGRVVQSGKFANTALYIGALHPGRYLLTFLSQTGDKRYG